MSRQDRTLGVRQVDTKPHLNGLLIFQKRCILDRLSNERDRFEFMQGAAELAQRFAAELRKRSGPPPAASHACSASRPHRDRLWADAYVSHGAVFQFIVLVAETETEARSSPPILSGAVRINPPDSAHRIAR